MSDRAPYSRVYWSIIDDQKFAVVYDDDRLLAAWLRLLLIADQAYPAPAHVPAGIRVASLKALSECGLVDLEGRNRYRIHGLKAEREGRAWSRVGPKPDLDRTEIGTQPSQAELSLAKPSTAPSADPVDAYYRMTGRFPSDAVMGWLDDMEDRYGGESVIKELGAAYAEDRAVKTLLGRTDARLKANARALSVKEREAEHESNFQRRLNRTQQYLREMRGEAS